MVRVPEGEALRDPDGLRLGDGELLRDTEAEAVREGDAVPVGDHDGVWVPEMVWDRVGLGGLALPLAAGPYRPWRRTRGNGPRQGMSHFTI